MKNAREQESGRYSIRILKILGLTTLVLLFLHLLFQFLNWEVYYQQHGQIYELTNRFDFDDEVSVPTWYSQFLMMLIGLGAFVAAYLSDKKAVRRIWMIIGSIGVLFSIDEGSGLHEFMLQTLHVMFFQDARPTESDNAWLIVLPVILVIAGWLVWQMWRLLPKRTIMLFVVAGVVFLGGAIGVDLLTSITERESFLNQGILTGLEEALELFASVLAVYAVADYLETNHNAQLRKIFSAIKAAKPTPND